MNKIFLVATAIAMVACNNGNQQQQRPQGAVPYPVIIVGEQRRTSQNIRLYYQSIGRRRSSGYPRATALQVRNSNP